MNEPRGANDAAQPYSGATPPPDGPVPSGGSASSGPAPRPSGRSLGLLAVGVAALAFVVALAAAVFSWRAIDQAKDAKAIALDRRAGGAEPSTGSSGAPAAPTAPSTSDAAPTPDDVPRSPGEAPELNERTVYRAKYDKEPLTFKATCNYSMWGELDEPRAKNDDTGAEIRFTMGCGNDPSVFRLEDGVEGSEAAQPEMTPQECADKIRTAPIAADGRVPVRKGTVICVTTDYGAARAHGDQWRMVRLEVLGVANDGSATVQVTAWDIPDA